MKKAMKWWEVTTNNADSEIISARIIPKPRQPHTCENFDKIHKCLVAARTIRGAIELAVDNHKKEI